MLTQIQQNSIRINIAGRGIETIDLEAEMVDHISSAVEESMEKGKSFRDAYKATIIGFGPHGLEYLQNKKNKSLIKKGIKLIAYKFVEITTPPKVFISLIIGVLVYFILNISPDRVIAFNILFYGVWLSSLCIYGIYTYKNHKVRFSQINAFNSIFGISYYLVNPVFVPRMINDGIALHSDLYLTSMIMISGLIFTSFFLVLLSTKRELNQKYGDYLIATKR